jgi:GDP-4-dehydro-6-deoxy-D-mannose reductase
LKILITGVSGFVGRYMLDQCAILCSSNYPVKILGIDINTHNGFKYPDLKYEYLCADLKDRSLVNEAVSRFGPDVVYHLAAQSSVGYSWENPTETFETNVFGGINLFDAVSKYSPDCKILLACTAEEYGSDTESGKNDRPITEETRIFPSNPYAISKACLDFFALTYFRSKKLNIYVSRSFNHFGPGQSERFVASDFARQIAMIEKNIMEPVIKVGNLNCYRDFLDVRDVVKAYFLITEKGIAGQAYNVCSGRKIKIEKILEILISMSDCKNIEIRTDKNKNRPIDTFSVYGDNSKLINHTGWYPEHNIEDSLLDTLNWWRERSSQI